MYIWFDYLFCHTGFKSLAKIILCSQRTKKTLKLFCCKAYATLTQNWYQLTKPRRKEKKRKYENIIIKKRTNFITAKQIKWNNNKLEEK
jgi:hypothetical protein